MRVLWCLAGFLAFGCSAPRMAANGPVGVVGPGQLAAPSKDDQATTLRPQYIGPADTLTVEVVGLADLSREVRVDANGKISLPVAGVVEVAGKTPAEVAVDVTQKMRAGYVRNPQVIVNVKENGSQTIAVDGAVGKPGIFPVDSELTMMRAIAKAQGVTDNARERHVVVFRKVEGRQLAAVYDLEAIRLGAYADPRLYPNDIVVVGSSRARALFPQILQAASLLSSPLILLIR